MKKKLVRRRLKWAGRVGRMGNEKLAKRANAQKMEWEKWRRRPRLRWEDCVKRDLEEWQKYEEKQNSKRKKELGTVERE